jgi:hypothetical protein
LNSSYHPKPLDESCFTAWPERGPASKIPYEYLLVIWDDLELEYLPVYVENSAGIQGYEKYITSPAQQLLVAA